MVDTQKTKNKTNQAKYEPSNLGQTTIPRDRQTKERHRIVYFAILADHRVKLKEHKKKDKYLDLAREFKTP